MILSDVSIFEALDQGEIEIDPLEKDNVQPSSIDIRVDNLFRVFRNDSTPYIDPKLPQEDLTELVDVDLDSAFILHPGEFVLGSTLERIARLGLLIHSTAGFINPGWDGHITLELSNVANLPIAIYPGMKIGQVSFMQLTKPASVGYGAGIGSKYKGQRGPTPSKYYMNFEEDDKK